MNRQPKDGFCTKTPRKALFNKKQSRSPWSGAFVAKLFFSCKPKKYEHTQTSDSAKQTLIGQAGIAAAADNDMVENPHPH